MGRKDRSEDGYFDLFYRNGWAYLAVHPPGPRGTPVYHDDIRNRMRILGVPHVDPSRVRQIAEDARGVPEALVEWPEGERLASQVIVAISEDEMSATVTVTAPKKGASAPDAQSVRDALTRAGVTYGVDDERLSDLLHNNRYDEPVVIAQGSLPVHAQSATIQYHFNTNRGKPYLELDFGRIDLRELNFIENRYEGDLLASLLPPVKPKDGTTVTGTTVYAETTTEPVQLSAGENTELSTDGTAVYATMDGNVKLDRGKVTVEPLVYVERVDYETGNIDFDGSVVVEKDIADRFVVKAGGDVQVGGGVGRATVEAGGNVLLKRGINGGGEGRIECGGNLFAKYVESSTVACKDHVFVEEAIMHSRISAWKHCVLNGRRAEIIGCAIIVGGTLWCKKLGSIAEAPVHVSVGVSPDFLLEYRRTNMELAEREDRLERVHQQLEQVERALAEGHSAEKLDQAREQLAGEATSLTEEVRGLRRSYHEMRDQLTASRKSMVVVEDTVYKGATITFGSVEYRAPDRGARKTIFRFDGRVIQEVGYNSADAPRLKFDEEPDETAETTERDAGTTRDSDSM
jgi:hypothetical protein